MRLHNFISSLLAGLGASTVHIVLMSVKHRVGILPDFEPYEDLQRLLSSMTELSFEGPFSWLLPFINGALILGFVFGRLFIHLPGRTAIAKGSTFGFAAWLVVGLGLLPLADRGLFAFKLGLGVLPGVLMFVMIMTYAIVMSLLYVWFLAPYPRKSKSLH